MQSKGVPRKGDLQYSLDLGQNDPVHARQKHLNLTISRTNRRKSIEDNIFISNMKFMSSESNPAFSKDFDKGQDTERFKTNTFSSRLQEDETNITSDLKPRTLFNKSQLSPDLNNVKTGARILGSHNRYSNRSFDNGQRYSPPPEVTYKKYVGDISLISKGNSNILKQSLPSRLDVPATHPALVKSLENQRYSKIQREIEENEEIENGNVEIAVDSVQSHIKLIMRLIKATHISLEEYK